MPYVQQAQCVYWCEKPAALYATLNKHKSQLSKQQGLAGKSPPHALKLNSMHACIQEASVLIFAAGCSSPGLPILKPCSKCLFVSAYRR